MIEQIPLVEDIQNYAQNIVDTVREPLLILDATLRVRSANRAFYQTFHVSPAETEGRLIYEMIGDVPQYIVTDINKLRQVFINVLGNAVKFTEQGGIAVRVRADRDGAEPFLRVEVEDTGPGISPEDQDKLFRHFEQTKTGQQAGTGTGLGLAISREFVRLMGGDITLKSQVGKGSVFVLRLPLKAGEAQAVEAKEKPRHVVKLQSGQATCRVLIADDIEDNRQLLAQLLAPVGFEIRLATNGAEAIREFEQWRPHLILMDGHEAIRRIRATAGGKEPKIIAVTAATSPKIWAHRNCSPPLRMGGGWRVGRELAKKVVTGLPPPGADA